MNKKHMTVGELKKSLRKIPNEVPVFISIDPEGNYFNELFEVAFGNYSPEECEEIFNQPILDGKAVILWP